MFFWYMEKKISILLTFVLFTLSAFGQSDMMFVLASQKTLKIDTIYNSTTWTAPVGVTFITVEAIGGGGSAGGGRAVNNAGGGGGAGGQYAKGIVSVTPGNGYTVTIGNGGTGVNQGWNGTPGGDTSFGSSVIA